MKKENKKEKVGEFKFKMNEHNDVIHVFIDNREKPVDSIHFMEHNDRGQDTMVKPDLLFDPMLLFLRFSERVT
jgi:hypothetical protein